MITIVPADGKSEKEYMALLRSRSTSVNKKVTESVTEILEEVRVRGDEALWLIPKNLTGNFRNTWKFRAKSSMMH